MNYKQYIAQLPGSTASRVETENTVATAGIGAQGTELVGNSDTYAPGTAVVPVSVFGRKVTKRALRRRSKRRK